MQLDHNPPLDSNFLTRLLSLQNRTKTEKLHISIKKNSNVPSHHSLTTIAWNQSGELTFIFTITVTNPVNVNHMEK